MYKTRRKDLGYVQTYEEHFAYKISKYDENKNFKKHSQSLTKDFLNGISVLKKHGVGVGGGGGGIKLAVLK